MRLLLISCILLLRSCDVFADTISVRNQGDHIYRHVGRDLNSSTDTPADEECATYEASTGLFEWQTCISGAAATTDFDTSAELYGILQDETGSPNGMAMFNSSPLMTSPVMQTTITFEQSNGTDILTGTVAGTKLVGASEVTGALRLSNYNCSTLTSGGALTTGSDGTVICSADDGGASGAPTDADYLVGTTNGSLSAEIVVGTAPGGELGGTWGTPTIDDTLSVTNWNLTTPTLTTTFTFEQSDTTDILTGTVAGTRLVGASEITGALRLSNYNCNGLTNGGALTTGTDGTVICSADDGGAGGGAPTDADYLVGTANGSLSAEIVVGTAPGGELGGTWDTPTIDDSVSVADWSFTSSINIPNGAAPTVDADGEIALDTTDRGQYLFMSGTIARVIVGTQTQCMYVENLAAADDNVNISSYPYPVTIQQIWCECEGTCTTKATFTFEDDSANAMTQGTSINCSTSSAVAGAVPITAGGALTARESWQFDVTNTPSPQTDEYTICWEYTVTRQ